jgi:acetate kinase
MKHIFVLNSGSSSLKCSVYAFDHLPNKKHQPVWEKHFDWKKPPSQTTLKQSLIKTLKSLKFPIDVIGHRIVHGGAQYRESVVIDGPVKRKIKQLAELAPLHNLADLQGIELLEKLLPDVPQVAVFDTAFHHTLPDKAAFYAVPYGWTISGIRRFGFHGISFQYCSRRAPQILQQDIHKLVVCHLGSGASLCAIEQGRSIDTTMGFTPLEGLMMDTRSGSIDPGILLYLLQKKKRKGDFLSRELYHKSGLLGVSGFSSDMRDIEKKAALNHRRARLALDMYLHQLIRQLGSMIASLGGIDTLVFTAGIGENSSLIREKTCQAFQHLGLMLDPAKNVKPHPEDGIISSAHSKVNVLLIHTQEAFEIARECYSQTT